MLFSFLFCQFFILCKSSQNHTTYKKYRNVFIFIYTPFISFAYLSVRITSELWCLKYLEESGQCRVAISLIVLRDFLRHSFYHD